VGVVRAYRVGIDVGTVVGVEVASSPTGVASATSSLPDVPQAAVTISKVKSAAATSSFFIASSSPPQQAFLEPPVAFSREGNI
jgi:hypothetical protein